MKLPRISGWDVVRKMKRAGYLVVRQRGSHVRVEKLIDGTIRKITVPMHDELKPGALHKILRDAELSLEEFSKL